MIGHTQDCPGCRICDEYEYEQRFGIYCRDCEKQHLGECEPEEPAPESAEKETP